MIYRFKKGNAEGDASQRELLGGKGANLAEMSAIGLPVPPGFTITTQVCADFQTTEKLPDELMGQVRESVEFIEGETGKQFGSSTNPLLLSVRSGAAHSMPGMMDTVLNLGLNDATCAKMAEATGNPRFAYDVYRRLINMFGDVVMGLEHKHFETAFDRVKAKYDAAEDTDVPADGMKQLCDDYKAVYRKHVGKAFPQDAYEQLQRAIEAVFRSWNTPRAASYREINKITGLIGTAANVQTMVFGNLG
ncbi:MAG: PEP/pyruvate-binding domain-containing protein, partial [Planctomycetota bacterium]